jgi:hypothetical protein
LHAHVKEEIHNASLELIKLHEKHPILHAVTNFPDIKTCYGKALLSNRFHPMKEKSIGIPNNCG